MPIPLEIVSFLKQLKTNAIRKAWKYEIFPKGEFLKMLIFVFSNQKNLKMS